MHWTAHWMHDRSGDVVDTWRCSGIFSVWHAIGLLAGHVECKSTNRGEYCISTQSCRVYRKNNVMNRHRLVLVYLRFEYCSVSNQFRLCWQIVLKFVGHIRYTSMHGTVAEIHDRFHNCVRVRSSGHHYTISIWHAADRTCSWASILVWSCLHRLSVRTPWAFQFVVDWRMIFLNL